MKRKKDIIYLEDEEMPKKKTHTGRKVVGLVLAIVALLWGLSSIGVAFVGLVFLPTVGLFSIVWAVSSPVFIFVFGWMLAAVSIASWIVPLLLAIVMLLVVSFALFGIPVLALLSIGQSAVGVLLSIVALIVGEKHTALRIIAAVSAACGVIAVMVSAFLWSICGYIACAPFILLGAVSGMFVVVLACIFIGNIIALA